MFNQAMTFNDGFTTPSFCDVFLPTKEEEAEGITSFVKFRQMFASSGIPLNITEANIEILFYLLYARHGSDPIKGTDVNQFKYALQSRVFIHGPAWQKRLEIQKSILALTQDEIMKGGEAIHNSANGPGTQRSSTLVDGKLTYINGQSTTEYRKSKLEGFATLNALIENDVTTEFLKKFDDLFTVMPVPVTIPYYITYNGGNNQ